MAEAEEEQAPDRGGAQPGAAVQERDRAGAQDEDGQVDLPVGLARRDAQRKEHGGPDQSDDEGDHEVGDPSAGTWRDGARGRVARPGGHGDPVPGRATAGSSTTAKSARGSCSVAGRRAADRGTTWPQRTGRQWGRGPWGMKT